MDNEKYISLLTGALKASLEYYTSHSLEPSDKLLTYDFEFLEGKKWGFHIEKMIESNLRELTNELNRWHDCLARWHSWVMVLEKYEDNEKLDIYFDLVESLVHECLLRPSSIRDTFTFISTHTFHQIRLVTEKNYPDYLEGDMKTPDDKPRHLNRTQKERRLRNLIIERWKEGAELFLEGIKRINQRDYNSITKDYRNLSSHTIGPRCFVGYTHLVRRTVVQSTKLQITPQQGECNKGKTEYQFVPIPGKMNVSYGLGGIPPLDLEVIRKANLEQFRLARQCYQAYRDLLERAVSEVDNIC